MNKDIRNLKAFVNWCRENRYLNVNIKLKELKEEERPVRSLNNAQIRNLLEATERYPLMKISILLALSTGLRRGDIDSLKIRDINFERNCIATMSRKTKKSMASRPVSAEIMVELSKYVHGLNVGR
ncbi:MAG: tyrosine-type recombinase/integrase, partial [Sedimentisphaerales bacterium]|nr:tyrosine-type recombinase/integrase [Sedimentisphaerales bacterium]